MSRVGPAALLLALLLVTSARGQPPGFGPQDPVSSFGPALDSLVVDVRLNPTWNGFDLGKHGLVGRADFRIAGRPVTTVGAWGMTAQLNGTAVGKPRPLTVSDGHFGGRIALFRYIEKSQGALYFNQDDGGLALLADAYHVPGASEEASGVELGVWLRGLEWSWGLEEVNPRFDLGLSHDFGRFDGTRADLDFRVGLGIQNVAFWVFRDVEAWMEARASWSNYGDDVSGLDDFFWRLGPGATLDIDLLAIQIAGGAHDPWDSDVAGWLRVGVRLWPDGRALGALNP